MKDIYRNFTDKFIQSIPIPNKEQKAILFRDTRQPGLSVLVSYGGTKTFYFTAKLNKRRFSAKIGQFPYMNIDDARTRAFLMQKDTKNGNNPLRAKQTNITTLKSFFDTEYMNNYIRKYKSADKHDGAIWMFNKHLAPLAKLALHEINRTDIDDWHKSIGQNRGKYIANRCLAFVRHILNIAIEFGHIELNPASKIKQFEEKSRDRFLQPTEINAFINAVKECSNKQFSNFVLLLLYTGQRRSNIESLKWEQVDFYNKSIYLPDTKNGEPQTIPLTNQSLDLLTNIKESTKIKSDFIFPHHIDRSKHMTASRELWAKVLKVAGIKDLRFHDLRRTMGSYQAITGSSLHIIGKSLGHKSTGATMIYARLNLAPVRDSMQRATDEMNKIVLNNDCNTIGD